MKEEEKKLERRMSVVSTNSTGHVDHQPLVERKNKKFSTTIDLKFTIDKELIDQVYQFSRMYWKSVRQQNLPVTIKYPEMVAEMLPYFEGNEIPDYGKDNLWFL